MMVRKKRKMHFITSLIVFSMGTVLFSEGYASTRPIKFTASGEKKNNTYSSFSSIQMRIGLDIAKWNVKKLGNKIQTTSVHPDDSGFLTGETTTNLDKNIWDVSPKIGLVALIGSDDLKLKIGADMRLNMLSFDNDYQEGLYDTKQQVSDTRPPESGSFVFTQVIPDHLTYIPFVGIESNLSESTSLSFELGFPYMKWTARSGHDRYGKWQDVQEDSWRGFGMRYTGTLLFRNSGDKEIFISGFYEQYKPEFAEEEAELDCYGGLVGVRWRF